MNIDFYAFMNQLKDWKDWNCLQKILNKNLLYLCLIICLRLFNTVSRAVSASIILYVGLCQHL